MKKLLNYLNAATAFVPDAALLTWPVLFYYLGWDYTQPFNVIATIVLLIMRYQARVQSKRQGIMMNQLLANSNLLEHATKNRNVRRKVIGKPHSKKG